MSLAIGTAAAAAGAALLTWAPWVSIYSQSGQDGLGDPGVRLSTNGLHTFPTSCFISCSGASTSLFGVLFMLACGATIVGSLGWVLSREHALAVVAAVASPGAALLAAADTAYLYFDTQTEVGPAGGVSVTLGLGAVLATLAAMAAVLLAVLWLRRIQRYSASSNAPVSAHSAPRA
jgi:hypothetical protein